MFGRKNYYWEYTYLMKRDSKMESENTQNLNEKMNKLGSQGWELISTIKNNTNTSIVFWFKRIKE